MPAKKTRGGDTQPTSRYARVKQYLDAADEGSCADYQGYGRFWNLPLDTFLTVEIYGVRMIAPPRDDFSRLTPRQVAEQGPVTTAPPAASAATGAEAPTGGGSCCHTPGSAAAAPADAGRGARSGLIKGLKGEYPFDGSQFPRLMWGGGSTVPADQIAAIEQWIDDGCPDTDPPTITVDAGVGRRRAMGDEAHPPHDGPTNTHRETLNGPRVRKNINCLTDTEFRNFQVAIAEMRRWDDFPADRRSWTFWGQVHANDCQHGWEEFLPWHRAYLYEMEMQMREWDPSLALPYWSWTEYYQENKGLREANDPIDIDNGKIPRRYGCWVTADALKALKDTINERYWRDLKTIEWNPDRPHDRVFMSGTRLLKAAGITPYPPAGTKEYHDVQAIYKQLVVTNPAFHVARWPGGAQNLFFMNYPAPEDITRILAIDNFFDFASGPQNNHFYGANETIHNLMHNFSGGLNPNHTTHPQEHKFGDMTSNAVTAYDPIFWGHHTNVDRIWWKWQVKHPGVFADNPDAVLPPWHYTVRDMRSIAPLGYEYRLESTHFPTDPGTFMTRFKSETVSVSESALGLHETAEIRLHNVQYLERPGAIRAYLNDPNADVETDPGQSEHFAGEFHFFQGPCIGGPGHCDPAPSRGPGDRRARDRKTPGHIRIDATDAVRRLLEQGHTQFDVHLVVLDLEGKPAEDVLKLSSVSLEFLE